MSYGDEKMITSNLIIVVFYKEPSKGSFILFSNCMSMNSNQSDDDLEEETPNNTFLTLEEIAGKLYTTAPAVRNWITKGKRGNFVKLKAHRDQKAYIEVRASSLHF